MKIENGYFIGIDVGTGSVRTCIINKEGKLIGLDVQPILTYNPKHNIYEQSTDNIWLNISKSVRNVIEKTKLKPKDIKGIGFDATCSLVVLDKESNPISVDETSGFTQNQYNVILWADHRAIDQANRINSTRHPILDFVGQTISPEMEIPKTLWLKENSPHWSKIGHLMDLPDFLTYRATGSLVRSNCSLTCKFSYNSGWDLSFLKSIGLEKMDSLGLDVLEAGEPIKGGLSDQAAKEFGLISGTPVGSAVIDAYAGALATLGSNANQESLKTEGPSRLAIICGTSSCHIAMSPEPIFVPGVWGPYRSVLVPGMYCAEGGQSSTGQLIDFVVETHPAYAEAIEKAPGHLFDYLSDRLLILSSERGCRLDQLTHDLHFYPDFHGNRSPLADPSLKGMIIGASLDKSVDNLALYYLATLQAIACQTRHIIETLNAKGYSIKTLCMSGGLCKSQMLVQILADATQCQIILPEAIEGAVVIGAAFLGVRASGMYSDIWDVMVKLGRAGSTVNPNPDKKIKLIYECRYKVFLSMLEDQKKYRKLMADCQ